MDEDDSTIKHYCEGIEYSDYQLASIYNEVGRVVQVGGGEEWVFEYMLADHLGNNRVLFSDTNKDGVAEVIQENHFYPFGLEMEGMDIIEVAGLENNYKYNGKEFNEALKLNDHGWRWYDPAIGRWTSIDPLAEIAPDLTPYRFGFNNPILYADLNGLFEDKQSAKDYAKKNNIKTGLFRKNKIKKQGDGTYAIENESENTYTTDLGQDGDGNNLGVATGVMVSSNDVISKVYDDPNWATQGFLDHFWNGTNFNHTEIRRDGSTTRNTTVALEPPPLPVGPGGPIKGVKTFADIIKGLRGTTTKHGIKYVKNGKDQVAKIYKSLRENGFQLISRGNSVRVLENAKTGSKIIFRKSKSGNYQSFDSITSPLGGGKNGTIFFN